MRAEIITIGTEILLGEITNTNVQYLAQQCAMLGLDVYYQTVVGDNQFRIVETLQQASRRAEIVICCGGLGPTEDDLTKECLARHLGVRLREDQQGKDKLLNFFAQREVKMTKNNLRQIMQLEGAYTLPNEVGLAVGSALLADNVSYLLLPGPPKEMKFMFEHHAIPWLSQHYAQLQGLFSKMLCFAGIGESAVAERLHDLIVQQTDPTIATYAGEGEVIVRLATKQPERFDKIEHEITKRLGDFLYAREDQRIEEVIVQYCRQQNWKIATAESCTGGFIAHLLTSVAGSSAVFDRSYVTYTNKAKIEALVIPDDFFTGEQGVSVISEQTSRTMAEQTLKLTNVEFSVAITGVAGPTTVDEKPIGLIYIAIAGKGRATHSYELKLSGTRSQIIRRAAKQALYYLWINFK